MSEPLIAALTAKFPDGLPPWVEPFIKAAKRIEVLQQREKDGKIVTSENKRPVRKCKKKVTKKSKASRRGKAVDDAEEDDDDEDAGEEEDDGLGDRVDDEAMFKKAEEYLQSAIELSGHNEELPYIWMTELQLKHEDWPLARKFASKAAALEPLSSTIGFRLAACYVHEKEFIQAHTYYERAISLLPASERDQYLAKLKRLREQSIDQQNAVFKKDPFDIFPLEVILKIMQFGQIMGDSDFVLKKSWVNRTWRAVLVSNCAELWKTLTFSHTGFANKTWDAKSSVWAERAGKIDTLVFKDISAGAAARISRKQGKYLADARTLEVDVREPAVLSRLASKLSTFERATEHLQIGRHRWSRARIYDGIRTSSEISCGMLPDLASHQRIQSIKIECVDFISTSNQRMWDGAVFVVRAGTPELRDYSSLKTLVLNQCGFDNVLRTARPALSGSVGASIEYQKDALHTALRGCPNLEFLEVNYKQNREYKAYAPGQGKRIMMPALRTAILPSPSAVWCIDITAPNLESLAFNSSGFNRYRYENQRLEGTPIRIPSLVPSIDESPCERDGLLKLQAFEIACDDSDTVADLRNWASRLDNVTSLIIRNAGAAFPKEVPTATNPDIRLSTQAVQELTDNLGNWFPKVTELEFEACLIPGKALVNYVRKRKQQAGCVALQRLTLRRCAKLSDKAKLALGEEVPSFAINGESTAASQTMARYVDDDFEAEATVEQD
ncbi:hypothetical protein QFC20_004258 [Naganishia adeliensis]|uniref:Uncharacterized protein n=1 Tax=Naganishia adeliensis TaxID=92952 RepID=A0ACC2W308_9TREE|nr:hypothetical protein QFC20_004258 [Naganishia adeliensis]